MLHHCLRAVSVIAAFNLLQVLSSWRFQLPLAPYSCLPFFFALETFLLYPLLGERIPTFFVRTVLFPPFSKAFHDAPFSPQIDTTATLSMVCLLLPPETCCNLAGIKWLVVYDS